MKIKNIKVWSADLGNTKPYTIAFKTVDEVVNAFVEITLENRVTGIGAGCPTPTRTFICRQRWPGLANAEVS